MTQKNRAIFIKYVTNVIMIALGAVIISLFQIYIQNLGSQAAKEKEYKSSLTQISAMIEDDDKHVKILMDMFHRNNQSKAADIAELLGSTTLRHLSEEEMDARYAYFYDICERGNLTEAYVVRSDGQIELSSDQALHGKSIVEAGILSRDQLEKLRRQAGSDENSDPNESNTNGSDESNTNGSSENIIYATNEQSGICYYAAGLDYEDETYTLIIGANDAGVDQEFVALRNMDNVLQTVELDDTGIFLVLQDGKVTYSHSDDDQKYVGASAADLGLSDQIQKEEYAGFEKINGEMYYIATKTRNGRNYVLGLSRVAMYRKNQAAWKWFVFVFIILSVMCMFYAFIIRDDQIRKEKRHDTKFLFHVFSSDIYLNVVTVQKVLPLIVISVFLLFGFSFYEQTLISLSGAISLSKKVTREIENQMAVADDITGAVEKYYREQQLSKAKLLALYLEEDPTALNEGRTHTYRRYDDNNQLVTVMDSEGNPLMSVDSSKALQKYCNTNEIDEILLFDDQGNMISNTSKEWIFTFSYDEEDQSNAFRKILEGKVDSYVQDMMANDAGVMSQYIGTSYNYYTTTMDDNTVYTSVYDYEDDQRGEWEGNPITKHTSVVEFNINTEEKNQILKTTDYGNLISRMTSANGIYMMLFTSDEEHKVVYSPVEESIGKTAEELGLDEQNFSGDYNGTQKINGTSYFVNIHEHSGYYVATIIPKSSLYESRVTSSILCSIWALFFLLLIMTVIVLSIDGEEEWIKRRVDRSFTRFKNLTEEGTLFRILLPSGRYSTTKRIDSRWNNRSVPWSKKAPEQKLNELVLGVFSILTIVLIFNLFQSRNIYDADSIIVYILNGNWERGLNIFAVTSCVIVAIMVLTLMYFASIPIRLVTILFGTKTETIGQLVISVLRYGSAIATLFYCLYLLGFDSTSLLASAGIMSLIVGFGAQSLIKDIIAGIFIIFEGEFRIGDIVNIGGYRGQVLEIGLRTTKIMSNDHNVKIFNNNDITGVINMTRINSILALEFKIPTHFDPETLEEIFAKELPEIAVKIPLLKGVPRYRGIKTFDTNTMTVVVKAACREQDINKVTYQLNRELVEMLQRYELQ